MELYNSEFVYFDWDKELDGKKGFVAQNIASLKSQVNGNSKTMVTLSGSDDDVCPFTYYVDNRITCDYQFCYYDPDYEVKKAFMDGETIQARYSPEKCDADAKHGWFDIDLDRAAGGFNFDDFELRLKPMRWHVVLGALQILGITKDPQGKHIYFTGDEEECKEWIDEHKNLVGTMIAWEEGKTIQYYHHDDWRDVANNNPMWGLNDTYRVKPDECEYVPFDSVDEFIADWDNTHLSSANRPEGTMPLIWVKCKASKCIYLIEGYDCEDNEVGIGGVWFALNDVFDDYTFADGSIIGKVKE